MSVSHVIRTHKKPLETPSKLTVVLIKIGMYIAALAKQKVAKTQSEKRFASSVTRANSAPSNSRAFHRGEALVISKRIDSHWMVIWR